MVMPLKQGSLEEEEIKSLNLITFIDIMWRFLKRQLNIWVWRYEERSGLGYKLGSHFIDNH